MERSEHFRVSSVLLGRNPGQETIFPHPIRAAGEKLRMRNDFYPSHPCHWGEIPDRQFELYTLPIFQAKSYRSVSQNKVNHRFVVPSGHKTGKKLPKCLPEHYPTGTRQDIFQHGSILATEIFFKIGSHRHKSICASLQVSLAQIDLNRWRAYMPAVMPANHLAVYQHGYQFLAHLAIYRGQLDMFQYCKTPREANTQASRSMVNRQHRWQIR